MLGGVSCLLVVSSTAVSQPLELLSEPDIFKVKAISHEKGDILKCYVTESFFFLLMLEQIFILLSYENRKKQNNNNKKKTKKHFLTNFSSEFFFFGGGGRGGRGGGGGKKSIKIHFQWDTIPYKMRDWVKYTSCDINTGTLYLPFLFSSALSF